MRPTLALVLAVFLSGTFSLPASSKDKISYFECRADNDDAPSIFAIDEATKKVCDRAVQETWFEPSEFDANKISWSDGASTKAIYRTGKDKRYERDVLLLVHIGRCKRVAAPSTQPCKN